MMFGTLILLAASVSASHPVSPVRNDAANFRALSGVSARATVSIRIMSGVKFGPDTLSGAEGATRRQSQIVDATGQMRSAELLEFQ